MKIIIAVLLFSCTLSAYVAPPKPLPVLPTSSVILNADGWVICGDTDWQRPTGDGCRITTRNCTGIFSCEPTVTVTSYRQFLKERKPKATYLGVQLVYLQYDIRAIVYYKE